MFASASGELKTRALPKLRCKFAVTLKTPPLPFTDSRYCSREQSATSSDRNVCFGEGRVEDARAAEVALQVRRDFENPAFTFHRLQILFARTIGNVFAKHHDARIARHLGVQSAIDQVDHRSRIAGELHLIFSVESFGRRIDVR